MSEARAIYTISDSNMAGLEWEWTFTLRRTADRKFTLAARQTSNEPPLQRIPAARGLWSGVELYEALERMVDEAGYPDAVMDDVQSIGAAVAEVDASLGADFIRAYETREERQESQVPSGPTVSGSDEAEPFVTHDEFGETIARYVMRFGDLKVRFPGGGYGYPSARSRAWGFLNNYVANHGRLPSGRYGMRSDEGPYHDYSDLPAFHETVLAERAAERGRRNADQAAG